jgi:hypothetical protein
VFVLDFMDQVHQFALDQVEVVQLEDAWHLEYEDLDYFYQAAELAILFVVIDEL